MIKEDCIFCKIIKGDIPSYKVYEDADFIGILDIFPNTKGMTLLIPKNHYDSYVFDMPDGIYSKFFLTAKKLGKIMDSKLATERTAMVAEGMGVNHAHIKLYPLNGVEKDFKAILPEERVYFEKYQGYLSTLLGPQATEEELKEILKKFNL